MRLLSLIVASATLCSQVSLVDASVLKPNPSCKTNACLSAVQSNRHHSDHKEWLPGCTSFFRTTITPKPATKTTATTVVRTTTTVVTKTDVRTVRVTAVERTTATVHKRTTVATVTVTAGASVVPKLMQRDAEQELLPRAADAACPTTRAGPSQLPSYASACQNTMAYSSACSCVGVKHGVTTLPRCTTTSKVTQTRTVKATSTKHVGASTTVTVATRTLTATTTVTDKVTATVTVCAQPTNVKFVINSLDGSIVNGDLKKGSIFGQNLGILTQLLGPGDPVHFTLDNDGHLVTDSGEELGVLAGTGTSFRLLPQPLGGLLGQYELPTCRVGPYPNCKQVSCDLGNGRNKFAYCDSLAADLGKGLALVGELPLLGDCKYVNVTVA